MQYIKIFNSIHLNIQLYWIKLFLENKIIFMFH